MLKEKLKEIILKQEELKDLRFKEGLKSKYAITSANRVKCHYYRLKLKKEFKLGTKRDSIIRVLHIGQIVDDFGNVGYQGETLCNFQVLHKSRLEINTFGFYDYLKDWYLEKLTFKELWGLRKIYKDK